MPHSQKILKNPLRIALATLLIGMAMQAINIPYSSGIILISFMAIMVMYGLRFKNKAQKKTIDIIKMALVLFWTTNGILNILNFQYTLIFQIGTALTFISWFALEGTAYFMDGERNGKNSIMEVVWNFVMVVGVLTIIMGSLMHLLNWNYSFPTITIGLTIVTAYILKDIFSPTKEETKDNDNTEFLM